MSESTGDIAADEMLRLKQEVERLRREVWKLDKEVSVKRDDCYAAEKTIVELRAERISALSWRDCADRLTREVAEARDLLRRHLAFRGKPHEEEWVDGGPSYRAAVVLHGDSAAWLQRTEPRPAAPVVEAQGEPK